MAERTINGRIKAGAILAAIIGYAAYSSDQPTATTKQLEGKTEESFRLVHAIGNTEKMIAKGLSKSDCQVRKREQIAVAEALGTHNEHLGIGSITCLPESVFND